MELRNEIYRLNKMHKLIKAHKTGTPQEFAEKLNVSKRQVYNILDELRLLGAKITYKRTCCSFCYTNSFELHLYLLVECSD